MERITFEDSREKRFSNVNLVIKRSDQCQPEDDKENYHPNNPLRDDADHGPINFTRSAFKYTKSPFSTQLPSTHQTTSIKDVRMRLDFSKVANTAPINNLERNFFSDKKCSFDENYISKKFVLRKMNCNDLRQEVDKLNKVIQLLL